jgi:hypothetical protein
MKTMIASLPRERAINFLSFPRKGAGTRVEYSLPFAKREKREEEIKARSSWRENQTAVSKRTCRHAHATDEKVVETNKEKGERNLAVANLAGGE